MSLLVMAILWCFTFVMLFLGDFLVRMVLHFGYLPAFLTRNDAICLSPALGRLDSPLFALQVPCFLPGQFTRTNALVDARLLVCFALVDTGSSGTLRKSRSNGSYSKHGS